LTKIRNKVTLSTTNTIKGESLGNLKKRVEEDFKKINEQEREELSMPYRN
jgi:hypothetical protein